MQPGGLGKAQLGRTGREPSAEAVSVGTLEHGDYVSLRRLQSVGADGSSGVLLNSYLVNRDEQLER